MLLEASFYAVNILLIPASKPPPDGASCNLFLTTVAMRTLDFFWSNKRN